MKNFAKLFVVALCVTLVASMFVLSSSAKASPLGDPNTLKPGSDKVIYIMDAPEGGTLPGDGSGSSADNPYKPIDHEKFDPTEEAKRWHYQTAFYQATEELAETGGTIVVCGPVYFGEEQCWGAVGASTKDVFTAEYGTNTIKVTSVYGGVDYRATAGAKITLATPAEIVFQGQTIVENIDIETDGTERMMGFCNYLALVGEGVKCYPADDAFEGVPGNYVSLAGGHRYSKSTGATPTLVVKSGTYNKIVAGLWGTTASLGSESCETFLTIEGTTTVLGAVYGTVQNKSPYSGHVNIDINGGTFECDINGIGPTGLGNTDGKVTITITGGDFTNIYSVNDADIAAVNNLPAYSLLDLSGWKGSAEALAPLYQAITNFTEVKLPAGIDAGSLTTQQTTQTTPESTEPAESDDETTTPATTDKGDSTTKNDSTDKGSAAPADESSNTGLIIGIIAGVVAVAAIAVVVVIVLKKKKAK